MGYLKVERVRSQILSSDTLASLPEVYSYVLRAEVDSLHPQLFLMLLLAPLLVVVRGIIRIIVDHLLGTHLSQGELHLTPVLLPVTTVKSRVTQSVIVVSSRTN